jgi:HD superfamily phosphohydrolase
MILTDPIYGTFDIKDKVIIELLNDPALQRIKKISQSATTAQINNWQDFSRYQHCVGCMLLVRHLGASIEEQIAALLHDVSHSAFSHIIDYVYTLEYGDKYHENIKDTIILSSGIPAILEKYNFDVEYILNENNFPLLERSKPDLCADRVDYCLRILYYYFNKKKKSRLYFKSLQNVNNEIILDNKQLAYDLAKDFLFIDKKVMSNPRNIAAYYMMATAIKIALHKGYIKEDDFLGTDEEFYSKLISISDMEVNGLIAKITPNLAIEENPKEFDYIIKWRIRYINPKYIVNGAIRSAVDDNPTFLKEIEEHRSKTETGITKIKVL